MKKISIKIQREQIVEAVFNGIKFEKLIQHRLNEALMLKEEHYSVELAKNDHIVETEISYLKVKKTNNESKKSTVVILKNIVTDSSLEKIGTQKRKYDEILLDKEKKLFELSSQLPNTIFSIRNDVSSLINYSEYYLCKLIGSTGIDCDLPQYNINFGFHFIENESSHSYLRYFSTAGWKLNPIVSNELKDLKALHCPNESNTEFILKLMLISSQFYAKQKSLRVGEIINFSVHLGLSDLSQPIEKIIETVVLLDTEKTKWEDVINYLKPIDINSGLESILRNILLIGSWCQVTTIGYYTKLLKKGEQIITNKFEMSSTNIEVNTPFDIWNYVVITTVEDFFLTNSRLHTLQLLPVLPDIQKLNVFLIAKPIIFEGRPIGDFFIAGSYRSNISLRHINTGIKKIIIPAMPFIQREIGHLLRYILTMDTLQNSINDSNSRAEEVPSIGETTSSEETFFWKLISETFEPIRKNVKKKESEDTVRKIFHNVAGDAHYIKKEVSMIHNTLTNEDPLRSRVTKLKAYTDKLYSRMEGMYSVLTKLKKLRDKIFPETDINKLIIERLAPCLINVIYDSRKEVTKQLRVYLKNVLDNKLYLQWIKISGKEEIAKVEESFDLGITELLKNALRFCNMQPILINIDYDREIEIRITNHMPIKRNIADHVNSISVSSYVDKEATLPVTGIGIMNALLSFKVCEIVYDIIPNDSHTIQTLKIKHSNNE